MRHRKSVKKLGRTSTHRKATLSNLSAALFERKHIKTTEAKAKETRRVTERLITLAKKETLHARRLALRQLRQREIVKILFDEIAPQYADRPGGYTRVIKLGQRPGDGARMAIVELVGYDTASKKKRAKEKEKEAKEGGKKKKKPSKEKDIAEEKPPVEDTKKKAEIKSESKDSEKKGGTKKDAKGKKKK
jgi:large subunit ribosomal protein L17